MALACKGRTFSEKTKLLAYFFFFFLSAPSKLQTFQIIGASLPSFSFESLSVAVFCSSTSGSPTTKLCKQQFHTEKEREDDQEVDRDEGNIATMDGREQREIKRKTIIYIEYLRLNSGKQREREKNKKKKKLRV